MLIQNQFSKQNVLENQKNTNGVNADGTKSMSVLTIKKKIKEARLEFSQGSVTIL